MGGVPDREAMYVGVEMRLVLDAAHDGSVTFTISLCCAQ